jgi:hypothetical protein
MMPHGAKPLGPFGGHVRFMATALVALLAMAIGYNELSKQPLQFEDIENGEAVRGTDYVYEFQTTQVTTPTGGQTTKTEVYLRQAVSHIRLSQPLVFWPSGFDDQTCIECVSVIHSRHRVYLVISPSGQYSGGSAGYYIRDVYEVWGDRVFRRDGFLSCGSSYRQRHQLVFPSRPDECPEWIFGYVPWNNWEYRHFEL